MTSAAYPSGLDALANPTATTECDDAGFELDLVVSRIQDILEALEAKVGVGASLPSVAGGALRPTAPGVTAWGKIEGTDFAGGGIATTDILANAVATRRTPYTHTADVYTGSGLGAGLNADLFPNQNFSVDSPTSVIGISVQAGITITSATVNATAALRLIIDNAASPLTVGGGQVSVASGLYLAYAATTIWLTGLAAGTHTYRLNVLAGPAALSLYFRPASNPYTEFGSVSIVDIKR